VGRKVFRLRQVLPASLRVYVNALFGGRAGALSIPAIVHDQDVEAELVKLLHALQPTGDVARVAVEKEQRPPCRVRRRNPPAVELRIETHVLVRHPRVVGRGEEPTAGLKEELVLKGKREGRDCPVPDGEADGGVDHCVAHRRKGIVGESATRRGVRRST